MLFKVGVVCVTDAPRYIIGIVLVLLLGNIISMIA